MKYLLNYNLSSEEQLLIERVRQKFYSMIELNPDPDFWFDRFGLKPHLEQLQKRSVFALDNYKELSPLVLFLSIRLHDIGHYPVDDLDHAVKWENIARKILGEEWVDPDIIERVAHCVRAHRYNDILPQTLEAKMMACIDSASHFTDPVMYASILGAGKYEYIEGKIERDYRDIQLFPKIYDKASPFYTIFKMLILEHKKFIY